MSTESKRQIPNLRYQMESIEETTPPQGMTEGSWFRYVIGQGTSKIVCIRSGTLKAVTQHAEAYANDLNDRTTNGSSAYAQRSQKK